MRGKGQALLPNGLTAKQERVVLLHFEQPDLPLADLYYQVYPDSATSRANATKEVQRILKLPLVAARLRGLQEALLAKRERDIDEVDQRQYDIATAEITDVLQVVNGQVIIADSDQWSQRARAAVKSVTRRDTEHGSELRLELHAPTPSAELVYRRRGLLKPETKGGDTIIVNPQNVQLLQQQFTVEELRAIVIQAKSKNP